MSSGRRWTQQDGDEHRLPHGMRRVAYDADTRVYTFQDSDGRYYESGAGNSCGVLKPVRPTAITRPNAFDNGQPRPTRTSVRKTTFQEFLPPQKMATPSTSIEAQHGRSKSVPTQFMVPGSSAQTESPPTSPLSPTTILMDAVRKVPKMYGVVEGLRRSVTSAPRPPQSPSNGGERGGANGSGSRSGTSAGGASRRQASMADNDTAALLRRDSNTFTLRRLSTTASKTSTRSSTSTLTPMRDIPEISRR